MSRANKASSYLSTLCTSSKRGAGALSDCLSQIFDTVDELERTLLELKHPRNESARRGFRRDLDHLSVLRQSHHGFRRDCFGNLDQSITDVPFLRRLSNIDVPFLRRLPAPTCIELKLLFGLAVPARDAVLAQLRHVYVHPDLLQLPWQP
ncbi:hypothetical protein RJ639_026726 [Escallonia herrerae]|uniref:Uncharacterized protein n=1 Tax=Escallonia herrerae TaxID=1293975 RepID=A0AA88XA43_9ASTE|nr:hypothetical protein RJ639_026726 [Escallonia herrerae]